MIDSRVYYYLVNSRSSKALAFKNAKEPSKQAGFLSETSEESQEQVWMLKKTHFEGVYYLTHCLTGLVLEKNKNKLELHHRHEKASQYFIVDEIHNEHGEVWIKEYTEPTNLLTFDKILQCKITDKSQSECFWKLKPVLNNLPLSGSCILSCQFSGYVLQSGIGSEREGKMVQKGSWIGSYNQRWEIKKVNAFFLIRNMKNKLLVSVSEKKIKEGSAIILTPQNNAYHYQLWSLEERGFNTYSIKTAYHEELYIGIKDHSLTEGGSLILIKNQFKNLWRVTGPILI